MIPLTGRLCTGGEVHRYSPHSLVRISKPLSHLRNGKGSILRDKVHLFSIESVNAKR